ncbi:MAG: ABC transporter substrate-binding protein [Dongiaceae bacterium]
MNRREFLLSTVIAASAIAGTGLSIGNVQAADAAPSAIRLAGPGVGFGKPFGGQILGIVRARGLLEEEFKAEGIKIDWSFPSGTGPAINEAFANGQLDFANYGGQPNIAGKSRGLPTKLLASYGNGNIYVLARKEAGIHAIADFKGKRIAVSKGTILQLLMDKVLAANGLTEKDFQLFDLKAADQATALAAGDIDAAIGDPSLLALHDQGIAEVAFSTQGKITPFNTFGGFLVTEDFARQYPVVTQRVVNTYLKGAQWASVEENRKAVYDALALSGLPLSIIRQEYDGQPLKERFSPLMDDFVSQQYSDAIAFLLNAKIIRKPVDLDTWRDRSYVDKGLRDLGLADLWRPRGADGSLKS